MMNFNTDLNRFDHFVFDFDGVIVDSVEIKTKAYGELFRPLGETLAQKAMEYHRDNGGVSRYEKFKYYYKNFLKEEITAAQIDELDKKYSQIVVEQVLKAPFIAGVKELLEEIRREDKNCFIVSATPQKEIREIVEARGLNPFFKEVLGSPRDKKENVQILIERYSLDPQKTIFFGDAKSDYEAATEHRINFVAIIDKSKELEHLTKVSKIKDFTKYLRKETKHA